MTFYIPIPSEITDSHSHGIPTGLFPFLPIPILKQSFNRWGINNSWPIEDSNMFDVESKNWSQQSGSCYALLNITKSQTTENVLNGRPTQIYSNPTRKQEVFSQQIISLILHQPMEIYSDGNKGHSHSHAGCFLFLPIPIPNFVISYYSHRIPIPIGNSIPMVISNSYKQMASRKSQWSNN